MPTEYPASLDTWGIPLWVLALILVPAIIALAALLVYIHEWWHK